MSNLMKKMFKSSLLNSIMLVVLGFLLIFESEATIVSISYIIGAIIIVLGVVAGLKYVKNINNNSRNELDIVYGIVSIVLGVVIIKNPHAIASIIPFIVGIIIIINSAAKLQYSIEMKNNSNSLWKTTMIISLITTICGIILIFNPFSGAVLITRVVGILILIYAVLDIASTLTIKNTFNQIHEAIEETTIIDADVIEEKNKKKKSNRKKKSKKGDQENDD